MNTKRKFWIKFISALLIGGLIGYLSAEFSLEGIFSEISFYIWFPYDVVLIAFALTSLMFMILTLKNLRQIPKLSVASQEDQELLMNPSEASITSAVMYVNMFVFTGLGLLFLTIPLSAHTKAGDPFENILFISLIFALVLIVISFILFYIVLRLYNRIYPKRQMDFYSNNPEQSYFTKLDEAEKWIVYMSSYRVFGFMQRFISLGIFVLLIHAVFFDDPQLFAIFVLIVMFMAMNITYYIEAKRKYKKRLHI
jgi:hypothetical protein